MTTYQVDLSSQYSEVLNRKLITPQTEEKESALGRWFILKWAILERSMTSVLFIVGLSATIVRYFKKMVHRYSAESPKFYDASFWLQLVAVLYLVYIFVYYFHLGLLFGRPFLKTMVIFVNFSVLLVTKTALIETAQMLVVRDLCIVNLAYVTYLLTYSFAGYPWLTFLLYTAIVLNQVIFKHFLNVSGEALGNSVGVVFDDPENLDELVRLNINT